MSFKVHTPETAPKEAGDTLSSIKERYGFIPNLAGVFAESPGAFKGLLSALQAYDDEALTLAPIERQVVQIAVSVQNRCDYCTAAHSMLASNLGLEVDQIERLQRQQSLADTRLEALRDFATKIVIERGRVSRHDVDQFLGSGFDNAQVLEVLQGVALKTLTNYANHVTRPEVNIQFSEFMPSWADAA